MTGAVVFTFGLYLLFRPWMRVARLQLRLRPHVSRFAPLDAPFVDVDAFPDDLKSLAAEYKWHGSVGAVRGFLFGGLVCFVGAAIAQASAF